MQDQNNNKTRDINQLISDFCKPILTDNDYIDSVEAEKYIQSLSDHELDSLRRCSDKQRIRDIVQTEVFNYINDHKGTATLLFSFDSGNAFQKYQTEFEKIFESIKVGYEYPWAFHRAFEYINRASESYQLYQSINSVSKDEILAQVKDAIKGIVTQASEQAAELAAKHATRAATAQAELAKRHAQEAADDAAEASKKAAESAVKEKMVDVTTKVSETSVTIVGIFSAIVLTTVGGLIYSASVIQSVNKANIYKLLCVSSLIGFVCYNLLSLLFHFIEKIKGVEENKLSPFKKTLPTNIVLGLVIIISILLYIIFEH